MVFAYQGADFEIDVRHECTHALLHAWLPRVPLWLDEGLAEYFEVVARTACDKIRIRPPWRLRSASANCRGWRSWSRSQTLDDMGRDEYRDAWAWVHFMLHGPHEAREELTRYLDELNRAASRAGSASGCGARMPDLNRRLVQHFAG